MQLWVQEGAELWDKDTSLSWLWDMAANRGIPEKLRYLQVPALAEQTEVLLVTELGLLVLWGAAG